MGKYYIKEVKYGVSDGGVACGPVGENVNVSVNIIEGNKSYWITNSEVTGIPNFYMTDIDIFDKLMNINSENEEFVEYMNEKFIDKFDGILLGEYEDIFESIAKSSDNSAAKLIRYIVLITRCKEDEVDNLIAMAKEKYVDEIDELANYV